MNKRLRRIGSDEAHAWARNLRLGNPYAKLVLCMLTLYVDAEGSCFVGAATLAEDCELSVNTVRGRLAWLENVGVIRRSPQWIDDKGNRNGEGRGRRTSDSVQLLIDCDAGKVSESVSLPHGGGSAPVSPPLALLLPTNCVVGLDSFNHEPERVDDNARAREEPAIRKQAVEIAEEIATIAGFPDPQAWPPGWCGSAMRVENFLRSGYVRSDLIDGAKAVMAAKPSAEPWSIAYFERSWAKMRGQREKPVRGGVVPIRAGSRQLGGGPRTFTDSPDLPWNREKAAKPREKVELSAEQRELRAALAQR